MALKDDWKATGKGLGSAFKGLGKNVLRSVGDGLDKIDGTQAKGDSNVFNDGSWRQTGKDLGTGFINVGKSIVKSAKEGIDKIDGKIDNDRHDDDNVVYEYEDD
ncbi:MAG: hypothetical protein Q4A83_02860 [Bacillota bacterium]|nr:hypothetical protein [Bacillota bacterium]